MSNAFRSTPFKLDHSQRNTLSTQMENALRQAIVSGQYKPGESLPPIREWAKLLGVSIRVPEAVIPKLAKEGLIIARPRHGCIVAPRGKTIYKGHILLVTPPGDYVYAANIMCCQITQLLEDAGYLVSRTTLRTDGDGEPDLTRLRLSLRQSVTLAVLVYEHLAIARVAAEMGVPFVWFGDHAPPKGAIGHIVYSHEEALRQFTENSVMNGVRRIEVVTKKYASPPRLPSFLTATRRLDVREMTVPVDRHAPRPGSIALGAMEAFRKRLSQPKPNLPDLFLFTDDYLFQGALPVLMKFGIRIPDELTLTTFANKGNGPVSPTPFGQIEIDPRRNGGQVAQAILGYLQTGHFNGPLALNAQFIQG